MKRYSKLIALFLVVLTSCNQHTKSEDFGLKSANNLDVKNKEGLKLFQQKCYSCHSITTKSHNEIIAPPMIAVKKRYSMSYDTKKDFVNAMVAYASNPKAENALMIGAVNKFKPMPKQNFNVADLTKIANYIYDNEIKTPKWFGAHFQQNHTKGRGMGMGKNQKTDN